MYGQRKGMSCGTGLFILLMFLAALAFAAVILGHRDANRARSATQTQQAIYQQWDAEMYATMTAEAPGRRK